MKICVTGAAGFIGFHLSQRLCGMGHEVVGIDNLNEYYSKQLKLDRLAQLQQLANFKFYPIDIIDYQSLDQCFAEHQFDVVVNLAAQAGVRYSLENPFAYVQTNLVGFGNILELARQHHIQHLVYASSSSVYGANETHPFSEEDQVDHPISIYAASKKSNELMAHAYSSLFDLPCTGLRFFTVYGPWGRPDMALFKFTKNILAGEPIEVYNHGDMLRDFTYVDDVVQGICLCIEKSPRETAQFTRIPDHSKKSRVHRIYNIGNSSPVKLMEFITAIEEALGKEAIKKMLPLQPGDVPVTHADVAKLQAELGYRPTTSVREGVAKFVAWYTEYFKHTSKLKA